MNEPRGSAPRERDHRGGDHPVPSRTRQLSPPSPRVLQRKAAGGQGVALAEGAFLHALERPRRPAGPAGGSVPPRAFFASRGVYARGPFRDQGPAARGLVLRSGGAVSCMRGLSSFKGGRSSFGCSLHRQGTSPECDLRMPLECEARSCGAPCLLEGCELAHFAAVGGCVSPCFIVANIAARLSLIHPVSMEYLLLSGSADRSLSGFSAVVSLLGFLIWLDDSFPPVGLCCVGGIWFGVRLDIWLSGNITVLIFVSCRRE